MTAAKLIDTETFARTMRSRILRPTTREILVSRIRGSDQEADLTAPPNCEGLGRVRHFVRQTEEGWPENPLPIEPAARALGREAGSRVRAQLFQNAACGWRCWYCYVPFSMLAGNAERGSWITADQLIKLYAGEADRADLIDLSGGSPDLTPEWVVWTMEALEAAHISRETYLWSDDNLSTDYVFSELTEADRDRLVSYPNYGRVCCFKGFDSEAFSFNTGAAPKAFDMQFELFGRYLQLGLDLYGYVTLTGPNLAAVSSGVPAFIDRLQSLHPNLPLRTIPLRIGDYSPTRERDRRGGEGRFVASSLVQNAAIEIWTSELERRFSAELRRQKIVDVPMGRR